MYNGDFGGYGSKGSSGGSGTVTSVGLALPTNEFGVTGSPVTSSGTLTGNWKTQNANLVFAGPATGLPATPTFRSLVDADIANSIVIGKVLTGYVSGAGTVSATDTILQAIQKLNGNIVAITTTAQNANLVYAGPTTGAAANPTFRSLVDADIANSIVIGKVLTGYAQANGSISATDTILQAFGKSVDTGSTQTISGLKTFSNANIEMRIVKVYDGTSYVQALSGSSVFLTLGGGTYTTALIPATVQPSAGGNLTIRCQTSGSILSLKHISGTGADWVEIGGTNSASNTTGTTYNVKVTGGFVVASGTGNHNFLALDNNQINQTSTATGITKFITLAPTLTSLTGTLYGYHSNINASAAAGAGIAYASYHEGTGKHVFGGDVQMLDTTPKTAISVISSGIVGFGSGFTTVRIPVLAGTENRRAVLSDSNGNLSASARTGTVASSATPTINTDNISFYSITALAVDITSFTTNLSGTPNVDQTLHIAITGTASRAITWGASFEASTVALPTTTVNTDRLDVLFTWNSATNKWRCIAVA